MGLINALISMNESYNTFVANMQNMYHGVKPTKPKIMGDKIVILGNGPSQDLFLENRNDFLGYDVLCMNSFPQYNEKDFFSIKPKFYCAVDSMLTNEDIARKTERLDEYIGIRKVFDKVDWKMFIVTWNGLDFQINNSNINIITINRNICMNLPDKRRKKLYLKNQAMIVTESVAVPSIFFSIVFGFKEVALFGVDHDDFKEIKFDDSNELFINTWHAYDKEKPDCCKIRGGGEYFIYEVFEGYMKTFKAYVECRKLADSVTCHIVNYNYNSYVDAFEKSRKYVEG